MKNVAPLVASSLLLLAGCGSSSSASSHEIMTSMYPLQYVAQSIAGDHATIVNLTKPGQEPHETELSIKQTADLSNAELVVYERGLSGAVDEGVDTAAPKNIVDAAKYADLQGDDPHFWLDPRRLKEVAKAVRDELVKVDPGNSADYKANYADLEADLSELDGKTAVGLARCKIRTIVVSHDAFEYYGRRYNLDVHAINGLSPQAEPSPAHIKQLHDLIETDGVTTVFNEELASAAMAKTLADDLGLKTAVLDPIEGLSEETRNEDYLSLMYKNLAVLRKANGCT
jgi:zinc transport system substrate-binding protein